MNWQFNLYALSLLISALLSGAVMIYTWRHRETEGARLLALILLGVTVWALGFALEAASVNLPAKMFWTKFAYLGIVSIPALWGAFVLQYTGGEKWLTRRNAVVLAIIPTITLGLIWTAESHKLIYRDIAVVAEDALAWMVVTHGTWFWVHTAYAYVLLLGGTVLLVRAFFRSSELYRGQVGTLLAGSLIPWLGNALYIFDLNPFSAYVDLTPFAFTITGLMMFWAVFRFRLLDIVPVARDALIEGMNDGVIVLDPLNRVVDINPAAQRIIDRPTAEVIGQPLALLAAQQEFIETYRDAEQAHTEIVLGQGTAQRAYDLRISTLPDRRGRNRGRLIILRDITERNRAEEALRRSEETMRTFIEAAADGIIVVSADGDIVLINAMAERIFGYARDELLGKSIDKVIPNRFRESHREYCADYFTSPRLRAMGQGLNLFAQRRDGTEFPAEIALSYVETEEGIRVLAFVADITDRKLAEEELSNYQLQLEKSYRREQERRQLSETLREVARVVSSTLDRAQVLNLILDYLEQVITYHRATVTLLEGETLTILGGRDKMGGRVEHSSFPMNKYPLNLEIIQNKRSLLLRDVTQDERWHQSSTTWGIRSFIGAPLLFRDQVIGLIGVGRLDQIEYTEDDAQTVFAFASQVAISMRNAQLYAATQERNRRLALLYEISLAVNTIYDLSTLLTAVCQKLVENFDIDHSGVMLFADDYAYGEVVAEYPPQNAVGMRIELAGYTATERLIATAQPQAIAAAQNDPAMEKVRAVMRALGIQSILLVPLIVKKRVIGSFGLDVTAALREFEPAEIALCQTIAAQLAIAIENARLTAREQARLAASAL